MYHARVDHKIKEAKCVKGDNMDAARNVFKRALSEVAEVVCGRK